MSRRKFLKVLGGTLLLPASAFSQSQPAQPGNLRMSGGGKTTYVTDTGNAVTNGANLQAALDAAAGRDIITLTPGATYQGPIYLRNGAQGGTDYITVRSAAADNLLPAQGKRMTPTYSDRLPMIAAAGGGAAVDALPSSHHWKFQCVEFVTQSNGATDTLINLGAGNEASLAEVPHHFIFDRILVDVPETVALKRGIGLNCASAWITNSYLAGIKRVGQETQVLCGWNGPGPFTIVNNFLEGAGINILFGGADPVIYGNVPSDIVIRHNLFSKRWSWWASHPSYAGTHWSVKNFLELKMGRRVLIEGNLFENNWADAQIGTALCASPRNSGGTATWSTVRDVTIRNNLIRHSGHVFDIGRDGSAGQGSLEMVNVTITNNLAYDIGAGYAGGYTGTFLTASGCDGLTVEHNTSDHNGSDIIACGFTTPSMFFRNNYIKHNAYGIFGDGQGLGLDAIRYYFPGGEVTGNVLAGGAAYASNYPADNYFPDVSVFENGFENPPAGNFRLNAANPYAAISNAQGHIGVDMDALEAAMAGMG